MPDDNTSAISDDYAYRGKFDGAGFRVTNFVITSDDVVDGHYGLMAKVAGFFGVLSAGAEVRDLSLASFSIDVPEWDGGFSVLGGGLAGLNLGGSVEGVAVSDTSVDVKNHAGGVVGFNDSNGTVSNSTASGIGGITAGYNAGGGVVGFNKYGTVSNSTARGIREITGADYAGGVVGHNNYGTVSNSIASGIEGIEGHRAGGVVGNNDRGTVTNCLLFTVSGDAATVLSSNNNPGGALGRYYNSPPDPSKVHDILYPSSTDFSGWDWLAVGTYAASPDITEHSVMSYDVTLSADALPTIAAMIAQGVALEVEAGMTLPVDITLLPGTLGAGQHTYTWSVVSEDVATVAPDSGMVVELKGVAAGQTTLTCKIRPDTGGTISADLVCTVNVVEAAPGPDPVDPNDPNTPTHGSGSSNCNSGVGAALFALLGLALVMKRK